MAVKQSSNNIFILLILIVAFAFGYLYYSKLIVSNQIVISPLPFALDDLDKFKNININFSVLENEKFKTLKIFGEFPVKPTATGKKNLFAPF
jgi:hypothetical protein